MRDWLKSIGHGLGGLGLLVAALTYWAKVQAEMQTANRKQAGNLIAMLTAVAVEISVNERTLDRLISEPHRLVGPADQTLETGFWDRNRLRIARTLGDYGVFSPIVQYYEYVQRLQEGVRHGATTSKDVEQLRSNAKACRQQGSFVKSRIFRYLSNMLGTKFGK